MNIYDAVFTSAQVADAAGMSHANFRAYLTRESTGWRPIGSMDAKIAAAAGTAHRFSIYDVLGYALAFKLVEHGVDPRVAFARGMLDFAHSGGGEIQPNGTMLMRDPGSIFDTAHGRTLFVFSIGAGRGQCLATGCLIDSSSLFFTPDHRHADAAIVIDMNSLRDRAFQALGLDARDYE